MPSYKRRLSAVLLFLAVAVLGPGGLARVSHQPSAAATQSSGVTALRSVGLLDGLHEYACAGLGRDALSARRLRRLATNAGEKSGLAAAPQLIEGLVNIRFHQDVRIFAVTAAINAAGLDIGAAELEPSSARRIVRESLAAIDPDLSSRLRSFYGARLKDGSGLSRQAVYISFALFLKGPPEFELDLEPEDLPPEVQPLVGFEDLVRELWKQAELASLWDKVRYLYVEEAARYRPLIREMIVEVLAYLRTEARVSLDRRVNFIPNLLNADRVVNARNLASTYFLIVGPSDKGRRPMQAVRHEYLHFLLDPLVNKYRGYLPDPDPFLARAQLQQAALKPFVDDLPLMVAESLIRMVELGLDGVSGLEATASVLREYDRGLILSPYIREALQKFERSEDDLEIFIPELIRAISWEIEEQREVSIAEMRKELALQGDRQSVEDAQPDPAGRIQELLASANDLLIKRSYDDAGRLMEEVLLLDERNPSALFGLAQIAGQRQELDRALHLYGRAAANAGEETWIAAWAHLRRGNIYRHRGDMELARSEWSRVLRLGGDLHGADQEARKALAQSNPPGFQY